MPIVAPASAQIKCTIAKAPIINIRPKTKAIEYVFDKSSAQLSQIKTNTASPYGVNTDQTTGGLRHDAPTMTTTLSYNFALDPNTQAICLSYNTINVDILLQPKIYIAKEFNHGRCGVEVKKHEKKHVTVDRKIINKYTKLMGKAIQRVVNKTGAAGPFSASKSTEVQKILNKNIEVAVNSVQQSMAKEMDKLQRNVDSIKEYERVSQYCKHAAKKAFDKR